MICKKCLMDSTDKGIKFVDGVCNYCRDHAKIKRKTVKTKRELEEKIQKIREENKDRKYDCVIGVSGGVDSSYAAMQANKYGLRALLVHLDNGWNTPEGDKNVELLKKYTQFDLKTKKADLKEFYDLQRSFFKASVIDTEMPSDHAIIAYVFYEALNDIKYVLNGNNFATEAIAPKAWSHNKLDLRNLEAIHKKFGKVPLRSFPKLPFTERYYHERIAKNVEYVRILNYLDYDREKAIKEMESEFGFVQYGQKHFESVITRFYQGYMLPVKFNVDKRKSHLSTLILNKKITRKEGLAILNGVDYARSPLFEKDLRAVQKKLGFSPQELGSILQEKQIPHEAYPNDMWLINTLNNRSG